MQLSQVTNSPLDGDRMKIVMLETLGTERRQETYRFVSLQVDLKCRQ